MMAEFPDNVRLFLILRKAPGGIRDILINQDKDVPEELIKQIEEYDKKVLQLN